MIVKYDEGLKNQTFIESARFLYQLGVIESSEKNETYLELGKIEDPILAFDGQGISRLRNGDLIAKLFHHSELPLTTEYDKTFNDWFKYNNTWPPAIDTLVHLEGQRNSESLKQAEVVLDVACGTGMAGSYAVNKNSNIKHIYFSDIESNCVYSANKNSDFLNRKNIAGFTKADALKGFLESMKGSYDVILASAIPATPIFAGITRPPNPLFEGTQLLEDLLKDAPELLSNGGKLILSHSSLGDKDFEKFAKKYGAKVDKILSEKKVPFRVEFLNDSNWVDYLVENYGMERLDSKNAKNYPYWHTQRVKEISFS